MSLIFEETNFLYLSGHETFGNKLTSVKKGQVMGENDLVYITLLGVCVKNNAITLEIFFKNEKTYLRFYLNGKIMKDNHTQKDCVHLNDKNDPFYLNLWFYEFNEHSMFKKLAKIK